MFVFELKILQVKSLHQCLPLLLDFVNHPILNLENFEDELFLTLRSFLKEVSEGAEENIFASDVGLETGVACGLLAAEGLG